MVITISSLASIAVQFFLYLYTMSAYLLPKVRLRAGAVPWAGRVEVYQNGEWGTVCCIGFGNYSGNVVCRSLGYGSVRSIRRFGAGIGTIHIEKELQ